MSLRALLRATRRMYRTRRRCGLAPIVPAAHWPEPLEPRRLMSVAPTILAVEVGSRTWTSSFTIFLRTKGLGTVGYRVPDGAAQLKDLPWTNIDQVSVKFSKPVTVHTQDLHLSGATVAEYPVSNLAYNAITNTATWTLSQPVSNDNVLIHIFNRSTDADGNALDGEWADGADAYPSGNGTSDGLFQFRLSVLPGDVDQSGGTVNAADLGDVRTRQSKSFGPAYTPFRDVDGNGAIDALDLGIVRARQRTQLPAEAAPGALIPMPTSDGWYGAVLNARSEIASPYYIDTLPARLQLVTDLRGVSGLTWARSVAALQAAYPQMLVGTYHSARDAQTAASLTSYPPRAVPREGLAESQILMKLPNDPNISVVDYTQPAAREYLVDHVVQDAVQSGMPLVYLDSVSHNECGFPVPWATTMNVIGEMSSNLHALGKRVIINAAWVPGITSMQSVDQLIASGVDGVSLEMSFLPAVRSSVSRIQTAMQQYRKMLDAGLTVVFCPLATATGGADTMENLEAEQRLHAAFGMMFRKPGDRLFTNEPFWQTVPEWANWPRRFGPALGDATIATNPRGEIVLTRRFTNYTLTMNTATKEVIRVPTVSATFAPAVRETPLRRRPLTESVFEG